MMANRTKKSTLPAKIVLKGGIISPEFPIYILTSCRIITRIASKLGNPKWATISIGIIASFVIPILPLPLCRVSLPPLLRFLLVRQTFFSIRTNKSPTTKIPFYILPSSNLWETVILLETPLSAKIATVGITTIPAIHTTVEPTLSTSWAIKSNTLVGNGYTTDRFVIQVWSQPS